MFCAKCGTSLQDGAAFCPKCGNQVGTVQEPAAPVVKQEVKVMLDPAEVVPQKQVADSSKTFSGQGKTFGMILMIISIVGDLAAMCVIGFDAFIPVTIGATILFAIGFFMQMFCP